MQEASLAWVEESSLQEKNMSGFSATPVAVVGGGEVKEKWNGREKFRKKKDLG